MRRLFPQALAVLILGILITGTASATTYYIAANGSDSNNGTSKSSPWLHAPGMPNCSATCASTSISPGDQIIFRGGDTWHFGNGNLSPSTGGAWRLNWNGSASNCQLDASAGTVVKSSCIYVGVDQTYFAGSSWSRPILSQDNPFSTGRPNGCPTFDGGNFNAVMIGGAAYVIFDNFELVGHCHNGSVNASWISVNGNQIELTNLYFHGWTYGNSSTDDSYGMLGGNMPKANYILCDHNVFDGSDSSLGTTPGKASGFAIYNTCKEIAYSFFSHVSNGCICNPASVHDNTFQFLYEPSGGTHGNIVEWNNPNSGTGNLYLYNNVMHNTNEGIGTDYETTSVPVYMFNNVSWHYRENSNGTNGSDGTNCFLTDSTPSASFHIFNNTVDYPCNFLNGAGGSSSNFQNNHFIGYSPGSMSSVWRQGTGSDNDDGSELFEAEATANGEGYTPSSNYAPNSSSDATVNAGANLSSLCGSIPNTVVAAACMKGSGGGVGEVSGGGGFVVSYPSVAVISRPSSGSWDAGAYQFGSGTSGKPNPPSGLSASIQ